MSLSDDALKYHSKFPKGKLGIKITKEVKNQKDLSLAYSPGVATPCEEIAKNPLNAYQYTAKGNLVGVISNGTAVLGLGDIGPLASKPVMEGKAILFKHFAGIDSFDIEVNSKNVDEIINVVKAIAPTFGGINLEDIKAPECFEIEERLIELLDIPVFHDDQHGTAIVTAAALKNALELQGKKIEDIKIVALGAGAGAVSVLRLLVHLGLNLKNLFVYDSKGLIGQDRKDINHYKKEFAQETSNISLEEAMKGADVFLGLTSGGKLAKDFVKSMARNAIVFALANPTPEIFPEEVSEVRDDIIVATGRSDYPNQINNVLCFPFLFRGALDVGAKKINMSMKIACVNALSKLAKENVPRETLQAYNLESLEFGKHYILPKPLDSRILEVVSIATAQAAIDSGVAQYPISLDESYKKLLRERL